MGYLGYVAGGALEGTGKAMQDIAKEEREFVRDQALLEKQKNLARFQSRLKKEELTHAAKLKSEYPDAKSKKEIGRLELEGPEGKTTRIFYEGDEVAYAIVVGERPTMSHKEAMKRAEKDADQIDPWGPNWARPGATQEAYEGKTREEWISDRAKMYEFGNRALAADVYASGLDSSGEKPEEPKKKTVFDDDAKTESETKTTPKEGSLQQRMTSVKAQLDRMTDEDKQKSYAFLWENDEELAKAMNLPKPASQEVQKRQKFGGGLGSSSGGFLSDPNM